MIRECSITGCGKKLLAKDLCSRHYWNMKRTGTLEPKRPTRGTCTFDSCEKPHASNGLCAMHNRRQRVHGDPAFINPKCNRDGNYIQRARTKTKEWKKRNWIEYKAYLATRKKRVKQVTPSWAELSVIQDFYKNCPKGYHVDHIVPINGKIVTGLHIISNLQYLPKEENLKKGNKFAA